MERKIDIESLSEALSYFYSKVFDEDFIVKIVSEVKKVNYDFNINDLEKILDGLELNIYYADTDRYYILKTLTDVNAVRISGFLRENNIDFEINEDDSIKFYFDKKKVNVLEKKLINYFFK